MTLRITSDAPEESEPRPVAARRLSYHWIVFAAAFVVLIGAAGTDRKSTRLNSSH